MNPMFTGDPLSAADVEVAPAAGEAVLWLLELHPAATKAIIEAAMPRTVRTRTDDPRFTYPPRLELPASGSPVVSKIII
jgi:hypothetical protein